MPAFAQNIDSSPVDSDLAQRILREAMILFGVHGYAGTSVRQVVQAAGCTKPALYYYFTNKEQLFLRTVDAALAELNVLEQVVEIEGPVIQRIVAGLQALQTHVESDPHVLRLLFRAEMHQQKGQPEVDFRSFRAQDLARVRRLLTEGVQRGELREDLNVHDASIALVGTTHMYLQLWLDGTPLPDDFAERMTTLFLHGLSR
ncbi:MAG: TetR/AcrR family transcriptional regulator [Myxococcota bacterium]